MEKCISKVSFYVSFLMLISTGVYANNCLQEYQGAPFVKVDTAYNYQPPRYIPSGIINCYYNKKGNTISYTVPGSYMPAESWEMESYNPYVVVEYCGLATGGSATTCTFEIF